MVVMGRKPHQTTHCLLATFVGHSGRRGHHTQRLWLRAHHATVPGGPSPLMQVLWNLSRFATTGLARQNDHARSFQGPQDFIAVDRDGQAFLLLAQGKVAVFVVDGRVGGRGGGAAVEGRGTAARFPEGHGWGGLYCAGMFFRVTGSLVLG